MTYSERANDLLHDVMADIYPILMKGKFEQEINYAMCVVEILDNDHSAVWVKWGLKYDCQFSDLSIIAMATIADAIINKA